MIKEKILWILSSVGALNCLWVAYIFGTQNLAPGQSISQLFLLPGLYLLEIILVGILGVVAVWRNSPRWSLFLWACSGILLAFVILGAWSLGFFLIPAFLLFVTTAFMLSRSMGLSLRDQFFFFLSGALGQAAVIFALLRLHL